MFERKDDQFYWQVVFEYLETDEIQVYEWSGNRNYWIERYEMQSV